MHYQLLFRVMQHHGLTALFNDHKGAYLRRLLLTTVLATDMSVHDDFMEKLQLHLNHEECTLCSRQMLISQALLKCADISNPVCLSYDRLYIGSHVTQSRPYVVSQHWAAALMEEWAKQAIYEKSLAFKPSVQESTSPLKEAKSQVSFIARFARPLLQLAAQAVPGE